MAQLPAVAVSLIVSAALTGAQVGLAYLMREKGNGSPLDSGRNDDLRITGSEYGTIIPRLWGRARLGSNIIWSSPIRHDVRDYPSQGGKGVPQAPATRTHTYTGDFGVQVCRGPILGFDRIWADAELVSQDPAYDVTYQAEDGALTGTAEVYSDVSASFGLAVRKIGNQGSGTPGVIVFTVQHEANTDRDPRTEKTADTGINIVYKTSGDKTAWVKIENVAKSVVLFDGELAFPDTTVDGNLTWQSITKLVRDKPLTEDPDAADGVHADTITIYNDDDSAPFIDKIKVGKTWAISGGDTIPIPTVTGLIDPKQAYADSLAPSGYFNYSIEYDGDGDGRAAGLPFNFILPTQGTTTQKVNEYFEDYLDLRYGTGNGINYAPAFRETAMVVFYDYNLRQGRIPNFTWETYTAENDMSAVFEDLFTDCGLLATDYDLTGADDYTFVGLVDSKKESRRNFLTNLGVYFGYRLAEFNGKIHIIDSNDFISVATVSGDLLRARMEGEEAQPFDAEILVSPNYELPQMVRFNVMNPELDYHNETVQAFVHADVYSADTQDFNFPVVDRPEQARKRAEYFLLKAYAESKTVTFTAMPEMLKYSIGDLITVPINGINQLVRIEKITAGLPIGVVKIEGTLVDAYEASDIETTTLASETTSADVNQLLQMTFPRNSKAIPIISLPIRETDKGRLGAYIAVTPMGLGATQNLGLYEEQGADNYIIRDIIDVPSTCGVTDGTLGSGSTQLDIFFYNDVDLESVTSGDITRYPQLNLIRVGDEWLQFQTAVKQPLSVESPYRSKWRISTFTRGLFGTSGATATHGASEDCTIFNNSLKFYDFAPEDVGETVNLKTTAGGQVLEDVKPVSFTFNPVSKYTITNDGTDRAYDADSTSINELSDVLATVIKDLKL